MWFLGTVVGDVEHPSPAGPAQCPTGETADQELIRRLANGDDVALAALYDIHIRAVFSLALKIVGDQTEAEDVVQEVFSRARAQAPRYNAHRASATGWLLMMTRNRAINWRRARAAWPDEVQLSNDAATTRLPDLAREQDAIVQSDEEAARLRDALAGLPLLQRTAIELAYFEGLSQSQIAARLDKPVGSIKTRIRSGLLKLRVSLENTGERTEHARLQHEHEDVVLL